MKPETIEQQIKATEQLSQNPALSVEGEAYLTGIKHGLEWVLAADPSVAIFRGRQSWRDE